MRRSILLLFVLIITTSASGVSFAGTEAEIEVSYVFWSPPKFSVNGMKPRSTTDLFGFNLRPEFLNHFEEGEPEMKLVRRAQTKFRIGNLLFAIPAGVCLGVALIKDSDRAPFIIAGSVLAVGDILIGVSGYNDLSEAAELRRRRLLPMPTIALRF